MFLCSFFKLVLRPSFYVATTFLFGSCCNDVSCIVSISVATKKVCRDRVLSSLNLISCYNFILILRHSFLALSMFSVATQFLCRDRIFSLSLCRDPVCYLAARPLFLVLKYLSRHRKVYRDLVYQCSAYLCVATLRSLSQHRKHLFSLKYVTTLDSFIATRSVH